MVLIFNGFIIGETNDLVCRLSVLLRSKNRQKTGEEYSRLVKMEFRKSDTDFNNAGRIINALIAFSSF